MNSFRLLTKCSAKNLIVLSCTMTILTAPKLSLAQSSTVNASGRHFELYNEGEALMKEKRYADACAKFEQAIEIEKRTGTLFLLGDCYEKIGKVASAWVSFTDVVNRSAGNASLAAGNKQAGERAAALESRVPKLKIVVPEAVAKIEGLKIKYGKTTLSKGEWDSFVPIDPGEHSIETSAPERGIGMISVTIGEGEKKSIDAPEPPAKFNYLRWASFAVGVAGLGIGTGFGVHALSKWKEAKEKCGGDPTKCGTSQAEFDEAQSIRSSANTAAWVSNIGLALGGAGAAVFVINLISKPSSSPANSSLHFTPVLNPKELGGTFHFSF